MSYPTDAQVARARRWAAARGLTPRRLPWGRRYYKWDRLPQDDDLTHTLPDVLWLAAPHLGLGKPFATEEACYRVLAMVLDCLNERRRG